MTDTLSSWRCLWAILIPVEVLIYGGYGILVQLSRDPTKYEQMKSTPEQSDADSDALEDAVNVPHQLPYISSSLILLTEVLKLSFCITMLLKSGYKGLPQMKISTVMPFAVPALCYCINNNLAVKLQKHMDPATYMVLGNMKIVVTALLFHVIMKRPLSRLKWCAVGLLALAGAINSQTALKAGSLSLRELHTTAWGLLLLALYCLISGFSGVYSEYLLKQDMGLSLHYQNGLLYAFGVMLNLGLWAGEAAARGPGWWSLTRGYSIYTWLLVGTQAVCGLVMSLIMKHLSNMVRVFVVASAPMVTTLMAWALFGLVIQDVFLLSLTLVVAAVIIYNV